MTYRPVPSTTIETSLGKLRLVVPAKGQIRLFSNMDDVREPVTINRVRYHLTADFEVGGNGRFAPMPRGRWASSVSLTRADRYGDATPAAVRKAEKILTEDLNAWRLTEQARAILAEGESEEIQRRLAATEAKIAELEEELETFRSLRADLVRNLL